MNVYKWYKVSRVLYERKTPFIPSFITYLIRFIFGCYIPFSAQIGKKTTLGYGGLGIVIHGRAVIGDSCIINAGVTIGGTSKKNNVPKLGNKVYVGTGAKILGPVSIGNNVVIGANAVVLKDIPDNCMVVGIPAKVVKTDINIDNYL
ncbi:serine O-acetyltransferase [Bacillus mycoides]|uniref:serine O-acetyltransferase n=1 Tax=Bacillus mycoides TaxID=1405 RepID=UPI0003E2B9A4|nr:serine O-acetyltransferase [Bacillus mycoides]ETT71778.1 serine acetyltransferase [Bacillus mycoides FSL H7-687]